MNKFNLSWLSLAMALGLSACATQPNLDESAIDTAVNKVVREKVELVVQQRNDREAIATAEKKYGFLANKRFLDMFKGEEYELCYDRKTMPYTAVVDAHNHFRPFGGNAIAMQDMQTYLRQLGVLFANVYGIGQTLPIDSGCEYYLDCPNTPVIPSIRNDFRNVSNYLEFEPQGVHLTMSMSFPDLATPEEVMPQIGLLDREYPNQFHWMGEVNLVKQALFPNQVTPTPKEKIAGWKDFMALLRERNIPIAIHSDLGNNDEQTKYLYLMEEVLKQYPDNKIVWVHMGLSKELTNIAPEKHIKLMSGFLDKHPNLMLDISWRVIWDYYFKYKPIRDQYVAFFNAYPTRILPGTDFVASDQKDFYTYAEEVEITGRINKYLDDNAFRHIALGQNYFDLLGLQYTDNKHEKRKYTAPAVCK